MPLLVIPFPAIDPIAFNVGPFAVHWYALAYLVGFLGCWVYASALARNDRLWGDTPHPTPESILDLVLYSMIGTIVGGRLGQVIFYEPGYYAAHPLEIFAIWQGGMSFHGGLIGVLLGIGYFAHRFKIAYLTIGDIVSATTPFPILLVRIGNFINSEHWGRPTDVPWAVVFPDADAQPRHPSQLYEAGVEGLLLLLVCGLAIRSGALKRPGLVGGIFLFGYGLARIAMEFFREPDSQIEQLPHGLTMGMVLSLPMLAAGLALMLYSFWAPRRIKPQQEVGS